MTDKISITGKDLQLILNGLNLAQKRGVFSFEESSQLLQPIQKFTLILNSLVKNNESNEEQSNEEQSNPTSNNNENNDSEGVKSI